MTLEKLRLVNGVYTGVFDTGETFRARETYVEAAGAAPPEAGKVLDDDESAALRFAAACSSAEDAALKLISRSEQCTAGLSAKLLRRGHSRRSLAPVVAALQDTGVLDDERYARLWLGARLTRKAESPRVLYGRLLAKGIASPTARKVLKALLTPETELALLDRYLGRAGDAAATRAALRAEGFSTSVLDEFF
ncbi:MAG: RecX family transcriptional regulator [Spirochaetaceae bacterium]|jgi:SOS response regulatory protein OraA/RecX|nr:RecX family transcriptional regulator [Spirochaetaceae bacterium]